jgi:hypothetical protein
MTLPLETVASGLNPSGTLGEFLAELRRGEDVHWVLAPLLGGRIPDSTSTAIGRDLEMIEGELEWTSAGLVLPAWRATQLFHARQLFDRFDELIMFTQRPKDLGPVPVVFTSDKPSSDEMLSAVMTYMRRHTAVAAASDGQGLRWFLRQAQP